MMHRFHAAALTRRLEALPVEARVAFVLAWAERLAGCSSRTGPNDVLALAPGVYFVREQPRPNHHAQTLDEVVIVK